MACNALAAMAETVDPEDAITTIRPKVRAAPLASLCVATMWDSIDCTCATTAPSRSIAQRPSERTSLSRAPVQIAALADSKDPDVAGAAQRAMEAFKWSIGGGGDAGEGKAQ